MAELRAEIYHSVAAPKQFLWAPFELAIANIILAVAFFLVCVLINLVPFLSLLPLAAGHVVLVVFGTRNPHLATTLQSTGKYPPSRRNLARVSHGVKYVP